MITLEEPKVYETIANGNLVKGQIFWTKQRGKQVLRSSNARLFIGRDIGAAAISERSDGILETFYGADGKVRDIALHRTNHSTYEEQKAIIKEAEKWEEAI